MAIKEQVDQLLQKAISERNYREIRRLAKIAEEVAELEEREKQIAERRASFAALLQLASTEDTSIPDLVPAFERGKPSARERGDKVRTMYIEGLARDGILLERVATKKYRTPKGLAVGITYARELHVRADSWFMGLADDHFDCIILLCETADESQIVAFVLPPEVVKRIWKVLSRSHGQVKFHLSRTVTTYELLLPGRHRIAINQYINGLQILKET